MKNFFPGYYKKSDSEIKKIWEHGIIFFDTNVLLNLYRYSEATRNTLLALISKFPAQIYLPHQAALEYSRNRHEVIAEQEKAYKEFLKKISQIQTDLQSNNKPPFLSSKIDEALNSVFKQVVSEVEGSIKKYCEYLSVDPIYDRISKLFDERVTEPFNIDRLNEIYKEGEERYKSKVPPGFEDEKKKEGNNKFGDLVIWKQIIDKSKELKKDVIFVTDESKVDWWWKLKDDRIIGPRQELVQEIKYLAGSDFHMYSSERFLSYAQLFLKEKINQQAFDEIKAMKVQESNENMINRRRQAEFDHHKSRLQQKILETEHRLDFLNVHETKLKSLYVDRERENNDLPDSEIQIRKEKMNEEYKMLMMERNRLLHQLRIFDEERLDRIQEFPHLRDTK